MNVKTLIAILKQYPEDARVVTRGRKGGAWDAVVRLVRVEPDAYQSGPNYGPHALCESTLPSLDEMEMFSEFALLIK